MSDPMEPYYGRDPHVVARELATKIAALEAENERLTALFYEADVAFTLVQEGGTYAAFVMTVFDIVKRALPMRYVTSLTAFCRLSPRRYSLGFSPFGKSMNRSPNGRYACWYLGLPSIFCAVASASTNLPRSMAPRTVASC